MSSAAAEMSSLAAQIAALREERDALTSGIATKQAILLDLERRTIALGQLRDDVVARAGDAERRLQNLQDELGRLLAQLPTLSLDVVKAAREAIEAALGDRLDRAVRSSVRRYLVPARRAAPKGEPSALQQATPSRQGAP